MTTNAAISQAGSVRATAPSSTAEAPVTVKASQCDFKLYAAPEGVQLTVSVAGVEKGRVRVNSSLFQAERDVLKPLELTRARAVETKTPLVVDVPSMARLAKSGRALDGEMLIDRPRPSGKPAMPLELPAQPEGWSNRGLKLSSSKQFASKDVTIELAYTPKGTVAAVFEKGKLQGTWSLSPQRLPERQARAQFIGPLEDVVAQSRALGQDLAFDFKAVNAPAFVKSVHPVGPQQETLTKAATAVGVTTSAGAAIYPSFVAGLAASVVVGIGGSSALVVGAAAVAGFLLPFAAIVGVSYYLSSKGGEKAGEAIDMAKAYFDKNPSYLGSVEVPELPYVAK